MTTSQKAALSLLISVILFGVFTALAFTGLFDLIEARFYNPSVTASITREITGNAESVERFLDETRDVFFETLRVPAVRRSFLPNQSAEDIFERSKTYGFLLESAGGLQWVRFIDSGGTRIHYSTYSQDILREDERSTAYNNYSEAEFPYETIAVRDGGTPKYSFDEKADRILFSFPFYDSFDVYRGTALFSLSVRAVTDRLIGDGKLKASQDISVISNPPGLLSGMSTAIEKALTPQVSKVWQEGGLKTARLVSPDSGLILSLISVKTPEGIILGRLIPESLFVFPHVMKIILLCSFFLTVYLTIFLFFNLRQDSVTIVQNRLKQLQISLIEQFYERKGDADWARWSRELELRRDEITLQLKKGIKTAPGAGSGDIDILVDKSWDELLSVMGNQKNSTLDEEKLQAILSRVLASLPASVSIPAPDTAPSEKVPPAENNIVEEAEPVEELAAVEEEEPIEELAVIEEIEPVEELLAVEETEPVEELAVVEEAEQIEEPVTSDKTEARKELSTVTKAEPIEELVTSEGTEPLEDIAAVKEADPVEELVATEEVESVEELVTTEEIEPAKEVEPVEELVTSDETEFREELSTVTEVELIEEFTSIEEIEPIEELSATEEIEPIEELTIAAEAEQTEEFAATEEIEPIEELTIAAEAEQIEEFAATEEIEPIEELTVPEEADPVEELATVKETEPIEELTAPGEAEIIEELLAVEEPSIVEEIQTIEDVELAELIEEIDVIDDAEGEKQGEEPQPHLTETIAAIQPAGDAGAEGEIPVIDITEMDFLSGLADEVVRSLSAGEEVSELEELDEADDLGEPAEEIGELEELDEAESADRSSPAEESPHHEAAVDLADLASEIEFNYIPEEDPSEDDTDIIETDLEIVSPFSTMLSDFSFLISDDDSSKDGQKDKPVSASGEQSRDGDIAETLVPENESLAAEGNAPSLNRNILTPFSGAAAIETLEALPAADDDSEIIEELPADETGVIEEREGVHYISGNILEQNTENAGALNRDFKDLVDSIIK